MIEVTGDVWEYHSAGYWLVVPTNGQVKSNGDAVMGAGMAKQAKEAFPELPERLGCALTCFGNRVYPFTGIRVITFPTKDHWKQPSSLPLIESSALQLRDLLRDGVLDNYGSGRVAMVRPGCGHGGLAWADVKAVIEPILAGNRYVVVDTGSGEKRYGNRR